MREEGKGYNGIWKRGGQEPPSFLSQFSEFGSSRDINTDREKCWTVGKPWQPACSWGCDDVRASYKLISFLAIEALAHSNARRHVSINKSRILATILNVGNLLKMTLFTLASGVGREESRKTALSNCRKTHAVFLWVTSFGTFCWCRDTCPKSIYQEKRILRSDEALFLECLLFYSISNLFCCRLICFWVVCLWTILSPNRNLLNLTDILKRPDDVTYTL